MSKGAPPRRVRVAQGLALLALAALLVGALGPAERVRTTYSWPPPTLPAETPERAWYTPLLLAYQGVVQPPDRIVGWAGERRPLSYDLTSPFVGSSDLYDLEQVSTTDSDDPPADVLLYELDGRIPGSVSVPATATTSSAGPSSLGGRLP